VEKLLEYYIQHADKRFEAIEKKQDATNAKLEDLGKFKAEMLVSSKWVSMIISASFGLVSLGLSLWIAWPKK
jgi:hypothetical protein